MRGSLASLVTLFIGVGLLLQLPRPAAAEDLAVVTISNEVALSISDLIKNYKEYPPPASPGYDRENGAVPGFGLSGSVMTTFAGIAHIYGAIDFRYDEGNIACTGSSQSG